jgi:ribosomal protein S21
MRVHDRDKKSGIQKELRNRKYYEKPCEARRRRAVLRTQSNVRKSQAQGARDSRS